jgi:8-oxo-dGTP diphosphatase
MTAESDIVQVVAGVIRASDGGPILITRRPEGVHVGGLWEFPGGKVEPGEAPREALVREIREEVGIAVDVRGLVAEEVHAYSDRTVRLSLYECRLITPGNAPGISEVRVWCRLEDLDRYPMPEANTALVNALRSSI